MTLHFNDQDIDFVTSDSSCESTTETVSPTHLQNLKDEFVELASDLDSHTKFTMVKCL